MRVSDNTNFDTIRDSVRRSKSRMEGLQKQASSMKKLNGPGDDPVGASKVLEMRTDKANNDQYQTNGKMAESYLGNTEQALSELSDIIVRAKEIAIGQASGASSNEDTRVAVAEEVAHLFQAAVATGNRRIGDRYIFGGYKTNQPPVTPEGQFVGDDGQMMVEVGRDVFISMNVPGHEAFNSQSDIERNPADKVNVRKPAARTAPIDELKPNGGPGNPENVNIFEEIKNLRIGLLTGDLDTIRNTLDRLDTVHTKVNSTRAKVGSRMNGLQSLTQGLERQNLTNAQLSSHIEDADMAQVVSDLAREETVLRSALQTSSKLLQPKLLDFLK
jgi:flagellar hook-associated protein 3 FlgL